METKTTAKNQKDISRYFENLSLTVFGVLLFAFPLIFSNLTTDTFTLPKEIFLAAVVLIGFFLLGARMISEGSVRIRRTPFDLAIILFLLFTFISSVLATNRFDALIAFVPLFFGILLYFLIVNITTNASGTLFLVGSLILGSSISAILTFLSYLKIYILPATLFGAQASFTHSQTFTPLGSLLDQAIYFAALLPLASLTALSFGKEAWPTIFGKPEKSIHEFLVSKEPNTIKAILYIVCFLIIGVGTITTVFELQTLQKPLLLPFETGFQTAFASISQDTNRTLIGFLFGSGFGTYMVDFSRFKQPLLNLNPDLWSFTFFHSSSFFLELLATTGVLGTAAFLFIFIKLLRETGISKTVFSSPLFLSIFVLVILAFLLPLSFITQTFLFILLALFAAGAGLQQNKKGSFFDVEFYFVALKKGFISVSSSPFTAKSAIESGNKSKILPVSFFILIAVISGALGFEIWQYASSDILFQHSLIAASNNNGLQTYNDQTNAIRLFPYRDAYHRIYAQTNLALANSLAAAQPKNSKPSSQVQQTIYTLIQQSINAGRNATILSPETALNWQNLASIYRALIGFGQNAENFAVLANQQAILLDPNNPQAYINLGGVYYQLQRWDDAQRQFQIAVNLKSDYANAYYNLGHALENKGDLQNALAQYQTVKTLIGNNQTDAGVINADIAAIQKKMGKTPEPTSSSTQESSKTPSLNIDTSSTQLPPQKPPVKIPAPSSTAK